MREAQHSFDIQLRGYDRHQVAETIERLEADIRVAMADRDAAMSRSSDLAGQLSALHGEIDALRRKAASSGPAQALREHTAAAERAMHERHAAGQAEIDRMIAEARQNAEQREVGAAHPRPAAEPATGGGTEAASR